MLDKIFSMFFTKVQEQKQVSVPTESRFIKLENFASGKTDYIKELFSGAKGFNVEERAKANQFFA